MLRKILLVLVIIAALALLARGLQAAPGQWTCLAAPIYQTSPKAKRGCDALARGATQETASRKAEGACEDRCNANQCRAEACARKR